MLQGHFGKAVVSAPRIVVNRAEVLCELVAGQVLAVMTRILGFDLGPLAFEHLLDVELDLPTEDELLVALW